jgi:hypothetical protein
MRTIKSGLLATPCTEDQAAFELLERCVFAAGRAAQGFAIEGGDALAQLLFKVGIEQHTVVEHENWRCR